MESKALNQTNDSTESWLTEQLKKITSDNFMQELQDIVPIDSGSFGEVYRAKLGDYTIAIKKFGRSTPKDENLIMKEVKIQSEVSHENIVKIFHSSKLKVGASFEPERIVIFMEYCDMNLYNYLEGHCKDYFSLDFDHKSRWMLELLEAVSYLHSKKILHRDIKPQNILINNEASKWVIKVCDFGISSQFTENKTFTSTAHATPIYSAPELWQPASGPAPVPDQQYPGLPQQHAPTFAAPVPCSPSRSSPSVRQSASAAPARPVPDAAEQRRPPLAAQSLH